jgi:hypothetical protein
MFRFAHELKFAFVDSLLLKMRMQIVMERLVEGNIKKAVFLLDDTLMHLQNVSSDVGEAWKTQLETELLSMIMLLMVGVTAWEQVIAHINNIDQLLLRNDWYGEKDRWANVMAHRLTSHKDVGTLGGLPHDITWTIAKALIA